MQLGYQDEEHGILLETLHSRRAEIAVEVGDGQSQEEGHVVTV
jgi:hypothetical protein